MKLQLEAGHVLWMILPLNASHFPTHHYILDKESV